MATVEKLPFLRAALPVGLVVPGLGTGLLLVPVVDVAVPFPGPTKKKFPAIGFPSPVVLAKAEILKLLREVEEFTRVCAWLSKFAGCRYTRKTYLLKI